VTDLHGRYVRVGPESASVLNGVSVTPGYSLLIFAFDQVFLQKSRLQDCKFYSSVQCIGSRELARDYRYEFELSRDKGHQKVVVGNLVYSHCEDLQAVNRSGNCVRLDYDVVRRFMYDDKLPYKLRLFKIDEQVPKTATAGAAGCEDQVGLGGCGTPCLPTY
jgi:hypothetical protein